MRQQVQMAKWRAAAVALGSCDWRAQCKMWTLWRLVVERIFQQAATEAAASAAAAEPKRVVRRSRRLVEAEKRQNGEPIALANAERRV